MMWMYRLHTQIPTKGFDWVEVSEGTEKDVRPRTVTLLIPASRRSHRVRPFEVEPVLYRAFAETDPSPAGIQEFADRYGPLGVSEEVRTTDDKPVVGESLSTWRSEIGWMRLALEIFDAIQQDNRDQLACAVRLIDTEGGSWICYVDPEKIPAGFPDYEIPWPADAPDGADPSNPVDRAWAFLRAILRPRLRQYVTHEVDLESKGSGVTNLILRPNPLNLLGALWLQAAEAIDGTEIYKRCVHCDRWFQVPFQAKKETTVFCSLRCRLKAYRVRQAEARRLAEAGMSMTEIAHHLGSEERTVKGWIVGGRVPRRSRRARSDKRRQDSK